MTTTSSCLNVNVVRTNGTNIRNEIEIFLILDFLAVRKRYEASINLKLPYQRRAVEPIESTLVSRYTNIDSTS